MHRCVIKTRSDMDVLKDKQEVCSPKIYCPSHFCFLVSCGMHMFRKQSSFYGSRTTQFAKHDGLWTWRLRSYSVQQLNEKI